MRSPRPLPWARVGQTGAGEASEARAVMRRFRGIRGVVVVGLAGALVGVVPDGVSALPARARCRVTAVVANAGSDTVSTIDVRTRTKDPTDIAVGSSPSGLDVTPDGRTAFTANRTSNTVST